MNLLLWPLALPPVLLLVVVPPAAWLMLIVLANAGEVFPLALALLTPVFFALFSMLALCGRRILVRVARGLGTEPRSGDADLNPFQQPVAFKLGLLLAALVLVLHFSEGAFWPVLALSLVLPLPYLGLALEESLSAGLTPRYAWEVLRGLNLSYLLVAGLVSGSALGLAYVLLVDQRLLVLVLATYGFLVAHGVTGRLLFAHRRALDLDTATSPEQEAAAAQLAEARMLEDLVEELHRLAATGRLRDAHERTERFLGERAVELDPLLHERLRAVQDPRLFLEHGVHYLERLAERDELGKAWAVCRDCLAVDTRFRPLTDQVLIDLTRAAGREDARLVEELLADFSRAYPDSELKSEAAFRRARIKIELLGEADGGLDLLRELERTDPAFARDEPFRRYLARLRPKT